MSRIPIPATIAAAQPPLEGVKKQLVPSTDLTRARAYTPGEKPAHPSVK